jgi:mono/diheme cytochrome c family protein
MAADALASLAVRRTALALAALVLALGFAAVGCGGEEEASPTADTVTGTTTETTTTDTTETETTETDTTETETTEPGGEGDAEAGKEVFLGSSGCGTCHTLSDAGTSGTVGPNLDDSQPSVDLVVDRVTNGQGAMPSFSSTLSGEQIQDVAAYVSSVAGS